MNADDTAVAPQLLAALRGRVDARFEAVKAAFIENLRIPSVKGEPACTAPYGAEVARALQHVRATAESLGLRAEVIDDRLVAADAGDAEPYVAAVPHVDVVPPGEGWTHPPFGAEVDGDRVYARGAADDKGAVFASLLAAAAIGDLLADGTLALPRRVRVLVGGDEESGMSCVQHYAARRPAPVFAFTPDGRWPAAQAERGRAEIHLEGDVPTSGELYVERLVAGLAANVVPASARGRLGGSEQGLAGASEALERYWDRNLQFTRTADGLELEAIGKGAHAAEAFTGDSAAVRLLRAVVAAEPDARKSWEKLLKLCDPTGGGLGLADYDPLSGATSSNLGLLSVDGGTLRMVFDVRYPVVRSPAWVAERTAKPVADAGLRRVAIRHMPALYHAIDGPLLSTVMAVYRAESDEGEPAFCMGGRTYASFVPNCVAVGAGMPGEQRGGIHSNDEYSTFTSLRRNAEILAHLLVRLAKTPLVDASG